MIQARRVDFIAVPTQDGGRAERFYGETLGLERNPNSTDTWVEYEAGNVTLALVDPASAGQPFAPLPFAAIVLRVDNVDDSKAKLQAEGIEFLGATFDSGVCNGAAFKDPGGYVLEVFAWRD